MLKVAPSTDSKFLNELLNHPAIYPWVHGSIEGPMDLTPIVEMPSTIMLKADEHGTFLFVKKAPKVYEVHTQFFPDAGSDIFRYALDAAEYMFTKTQCKEIITMVPRHNAPARVLAKSVGFVYQRTEGDWPTEDGPPVPMDHFKLTKKNWRKMCQQPL